MTSSFSAGSRPTKSRRRATTCFQSGMGHLGEAPQSVEQLRPFLAQWREFFLPRGRQPVATALASVRAGLPASADPAILFHAIEHRIERRQSEPQRALGLLLYLTRQFVSMQRSVFQDAE